MKSKGCSELIRRLNSFSGDCVRGFIGTYENDRKRFFAAFQRFAEELETVLTCEFAAQFCLAGMIMDFAAEKERLAVSCLGSAYSLLSYLYGINPETDPVGKDYPPELYYGIKMNRTPAFEIMTAPDFTGEIIEWLKEGFGPEQVSVKESREVTVRFRPDEDDPWEAEAYIYLYGSRPVMAAEKCMNRMNLDTADFQQKRRELFAASDSFDRLPAAAVRKALSEYMDHREYVDSDILDQREAFMDTVLDGTFDALVHAVALIWGSGTWKSIRSVSEKAVQNLYTRDDVYRYCKTMLEKETAFSIMEKARAGRKLPEDTAEKVQALPGGDDFMTFCDGVRYLPREADCETGAKLICFLASQKL